MLWQHLVDGQKSRGLERQTPNNQNATIIITADNEQDLIKMFAMPSRQQSNEDCIAATQKAPADKSLKPGERYCMMDSGAGCKAADAKKEFGSHRIRSVKHKQQCVLADGTEATCRRTSDVTAIVEHPA